MSKKKDKLIGEILYIPKTIDNESRIGWILYKTHQGCYRVKWDNGTEETFHKLTIDIFMDNAKQLIKEL